MAIRTIVAPGVQINEIDKSGYTPAMTGTAVYLAGFTNKGEAYKPMEFTSRSALESYYGTPDNEAERYFYAAACETLNQGGRLFTARLPYDNAAFEKMVGVKYSLAQKALTSDGTDESLSNILKTADSELNEYANIRASQNPILYDLSAIDEFRADEAKVPANTFLIVDTTGATYNRVTEDYRRGKNREVIGIIPVVTTAANAMYVQNYLSVTNKMDVQLFESLCGSVAKTLKAVDSEGKTLVIDNLSMENGGLLATDLVPYIATDSHFENIQKITVNGVSAFEFTNEMNAALDLTAAVDGKMSYEDAEKYMPLALSVATSALSADKSIIKINVAISCDCELTCNGLTADNHYFYIATPTVSNEIALSSLSSLSSDRATIDFLSANGILSSDLLPQFGVHGKAGDDAVPETMALNAASFFPTIQPATDGEGLDTEHLKDIGVVVFKTYLDPSEGNKVNVEVVEAFAGSLFKDDKDPNTGVTKFIDTIINSQSKYINFFSNCFATQTAKKWYKEECDFIYAEPSSPMCLGLYSPMTKEDISISKSILDGLNKAFDKVSDINKLDIDIVPDAGLANIASYLKAIFGDKGPYDLSITDSLGNSMLGMWKCVKANDDCVKMWKTVEMKLDNFCKNIRKDCMFITDGLRPLVLQGQKKIVRDTKPTNTIDANILPYLPAICGLNTNYGAGYVDWFEQADDFTGDFFWCPPSIKAMGVYINTDVNFDYWLAPAGLNRGIVSATDVAFSPSGKQAGAFYEKNWNYAINYPQDGIVLEGQKTFQTKPSALDRVNVRRMMLRLERQVYKTLRYFIYENNTSYTRQRIVDAIDPIFKAAWQAGNGGINRYKIICDESNNTANVIDNNEIKIGIGIVPNKSAEFILVDFILGNQGSTWEELF